MEAQNISGFFARSVATLQYSFLLAFCILYTCLLYTAGLSGKMWFVAFHSFWVWVDFFLASTAREGRGIPEREGALLCQVSDLPTFWLWAFLWWNSLKWDPTEIMQRGLALHPPA